MAAIGINTDRTRPVRLSALIDGPLMPYDALADPEISGISYDSRSVTPGDLFVAVSGFHVDGVRFVQDAFARGAVAAVVSESANLDPPDRREAPHPVIAVPDVRVALASLAARFHGHPARQLRTIGVTGTDGKTTTSYLVSAVLEAGGYKTGLFSTVAYKVGADWQENASRQTTPEAVEVQSLLARMVAAGVDYAVLESTSHGLALHKLDHCAYDVAVFTNLSADHLDFHQTLEAYRDAKALLFAELDTAISKGVPKLAIVNADDDNGRFMASRTRAARLTYAIDAPADIHVEEMSLTADGTWLRIASPAGPIETRLSLAGQFNVYNALAAAAVGIGQGLSAWQVATGLATVTRVPGRMQRIEAGQPFTLVVDYAHTAASFEKVLRTLRPLAVGRLITVFGCAGERGHERRSGMGGVAARLADYTVITTEDPRFEDPDAIIGEIAAAMRAGGALEGQTFETLADRRTAIARAIALAEPEDVILLTGKGHEKSIQTAGGKLPWDEVTVAYEVLAERGWTETANQGDRR